MAEANDEDKTWLKISGVANILLLLVTWFQYDENKKANEQVALANAKAAEASQRAAEQTDAALRLQQQIAASEDERAQQQRRQERAPLLIVKRCCNQAPISILPSAPFDGSARISLRRLEKVDPLLMRADDDAKARAETPFVVKVANVGAGVAIGTKAHWVIEKVILADGSAVPVDDDQVNGYMKPYTWPATIQPNEDADLLHLPHFLEIDNQLQVASVTGFLFLTCDDSAKEKHEFRLPFTMDTVYAPDPRDGPHGTRLSFHFYEPGAEIATHVMAKPVIEAPAPPADR